MRLSSPGLGRDSVYKFRRVRCRVTAESSVDIWNESSEELVVTTVSLSDILVCVHECTINQDI